MSSVKINKKETYCIVSAFADDIIDFTETIQSLVNEGWHIIGGLSAANSMLYQSLIKK
ncbi:MAG: hypothetical protein ACJZ15_06400 [Candidatus Neomarinimicrobiota bacterium]|tara:strand:+ start:660 stop:833 length:174 start_codon:yes stop_codon:yes gene_type:complete